MILKDNAIALRIHPFGNTSRIVVWLSQTHGKLATLVKGSQREKSAFLGQYDLFYTCELLFYAREHRNLHILKECYPLDLRTPFRADWRACAAASYAAGALDRAMPFGPAPPGLYVLLSETLDRLAARTPGPAFLPRFELLLLQELGLSPRWDACAKCRADLRGGATARLDVAHGAVLCEACAAGQGKCHLHGRPPGHPPDARRQPAAVPARTRVPRSARRDGRPARVSGRLLVRGSREIAFQVLSAG